MRFWGVECSTSTSEAGALGACLAGTGASRYVTMKAVDQARRIAAAGAKGVNADDVQRYDVQTIQAAGVNIVERNYRYYLDAPPNVQWFLTPVPSSKETKPGYR